MRVSPPASTPAAGPPSSLVPSCLCGTGAQAAPAHLPHPHRDPSPAWDGGASPQGRLVSHLPSTPEPRSGCQGDLGPPEGPGGKGHFPPREASTCPSCSGYLPQAGAPERSPEAPFSQGRQQVQDPGEGGRRGRASWCPPRPLIIAKKGFADDSVCGELLCTWDDSVSRTGGRAP